MKVGDLVTFKDPHRYGASTFPSVTMYGIVLAPHESLESSSERFKIWDPRTNNSYIFASSILLVVSAA